MNIDLCFKNNGTINMKVVNKLSTDDLDVIIADTKFLPDTTALKHRLKVIKFGILEHTRCVCGNLLPFYNGSDKVFVDVCSLKCSVESRVISFNKSFINKSSRNQLCEVMDKVELIQLLSTNKHLINNQYGMTKFLNTYPNARKSIDMYADPFYKILSHKLFALLDNHTCEVCSNNTNFISISKGFRKYCGEHKGVSQNRAKNSIDRASKLLLAAPVNIVNAPSSLNADKFTLSCNDCGVTFTKWLKNGRVNNLNDRMCPKCFPSNISSFEFEIKDWLESLGVTVIQQYQIHKNKTGVKTIDIFLPEYNLGIEYSGLMYHSYGISKYTMFDNHTKENRNMHLEKTVWCDEQSIQLLQIFSNEWDNNKDLWKSIILNKCNKSAKIYARQCTSLEISSAEYSEFLAKNHMQGSCSSSIKYGMYYDGDLVGVMGFSKCRYSNKADYELIRFCNKINTTVVGGFSKLLHRFRSNFPNLSILSYANRRWSNGNLYDKNGFTLDGTSTPNYFYFLSGTNNLESRLKFQKHKLNTNKSESEYMFENGYRRIWDCGNHVYILK